MKVLLKELRKYRWGIFFIVLLTVVQAVADLALPMMLSFIINKGIVFNEITGETSVNMQLIILQGLLMIGFAFLSFIVVLISTKINAKVMSGYGADIRQLVFNKVTTMSMSAYGEFSTATLLTRTNNDVNKVTQALLMILKFGTLTPIMFVVSIVLATTISPVASKVLFIILPIFIIIVAIFLKIAFPIFKMVQKRVDNLTLVLRENLTGVRVIRAFNNEEKEKKRFTEKNKELTNIFLKVCYMLAVLMPFAMVLINFSAIAIVFFTAREASAGTISHEAIGNLTSTIDVMMIILMSLIMFCIVFSQIPQASASVSRINEVMVSSNQKTESNESIQVDFSKNIEIKFDNVSFYYEGAETPTLDKISFDAVAGQTIAIIGGTGCGKSTLINLLPRFSDATDGTIYINGVDIKSISKSDIRSAIGFIPQKAVLFNDTIINNIRYGNVDATRDEVKEACVIAQADDFITAREKGYDDIVEQGGKNLSGGQKQRLCIARALVRKAPIYIFDDSFSALDYKTDKLLREAMKERVKDSIVFVIAQRIGSITGADKIIVLNQGKIAGIGKHSELLDTCSIYKEIALSQISEEELENDR